MHKKFLAICIVSILGLGGCFVAFWLSGEYSKGKYPQWVSLGTPPEKAIQIVGLYPRWEIGKLEEGKFVDVYVQSPSGRIRQYSAVDKRDWIEADLPESNLFSGECNLLPESVFTSHFDDLQTEVIDCKMMEWQLEWSTEATFFVLLEGGSVWRWHYNSGFARLLSLLCKGTVIGMFLGVVLSVVTLRRLDRRR